MRNASTEGHWAIVVDAGYYALFHALEGLNALECRDSYTFSDAGEILDSVLAGRFLDNEVLNAYNYLFYFRRGVIYGCHIPTTKQTTEYAAIVEHCVNDVKGKMSAFDKRDLLGELATLSPGRR